MTLDSVIDQHQFDADFVKIDTQGSEYEILQGPKSISKGILVLYLKHGHIHFMWIKNLLMMLWLWMIMDIFLLI